jgi:DNA-binding NarL/FixJ family response regulator
MPTIHHHMPSWMTTSHTRSIMRAMSVIVADDQILVRAGIVSILDDLGGLECIASVDDGPKCIKACEQLRPDILLLDLNMPGSNGLEVAADIRQRCPEIRILILTSSTDADLARRALELGVQGFISKDFVLAELAMALHCVREGRVYVSPNVAMAAVKAPTTEATPRLTPRQTDVLRCIARGQSNKEIARELDVSIKTVEYHRGELIQRLDLHDVASLTRYAVSHGLV